MPNSPADQAGFQRGDVVLAIDQNTVNGSLSLIAQVNQRSVGDGATLTVLRDGTRQQVDVTFGSKPSTNG